MVSTAADYALVYTNHLVGLYIGLGALAFNYTFPIKIVEPPYSWSQVSIPYNYYETSHTNIN